MGWWVLGARKWFHGPVRNWEPTTLGTNGSDDDATAKVGDVDGSGADQKIPADV
jgi:hypothetical protein